MIDNYDSFTYNLVQYFGQLGVDVETVRNDAVSVEEIFSGKKFFIPDRIVISPGPGRPNEAGISLDLIKHRVESIPKCGATNHLRRRRNEFWWGTGKTD